MRPTLTCVILTAVIVGRQSRPTAVNRHHNYVFSLLTITLILVAALTVTAVNDGSCKRCNTREVGGMSAVNIGTCVAALTV